MALAASNFIKEINGSLTSDFLKNDTAEDNKKIQRRRSKMQIAVINVGEFDANKERRGNWKKDRERDSIINDAEKANVTA